jgi:hypothetical protein
MQRKMVLLWGDPASALQSRKLSRKERKFREIFAKIREKIAKNRRKKLRARSSARPGLHGEIQIALGVLWLDRPLAFPFRAHV